MKLKYIALAGILAFLYTISYQISCVNNMLLEQYVIQKDIQTTLSLYDIDK